MDDRIALLGDVTGLLPALESQRPEPPVELIVPFVHATLTTRALTAALKLAKGFGAGVTLMAVHVVPYPAPLECQDGVRQCLEAELASVVRATSASVRVNLVFARDRETAYLALLRRKSVVVIGTRDRWWPTAETRFARKLASSGHSVALIKVK